MIFIDQLKKWRENNRLEFKCAQGGLRKSFWETYSAFANTNGGLIVLGVDETPEGPKATGVADADALVQDLWNGLNNQQKVSANLLLDSDIAITSDKTEKKLVKTKVMLVKPKDAMSTDALLVTCGQNKRFWNASHPTTR